MIVLNVFNFTITEKCFLFAAKLNSARNVLSFKAGLTENLGYCYFPLAASLHPRWSLRYVAFPRAATGFVAKNRRTYFLVLKTRN